MRFIEVGDHRKDGITGGHERKEDAGDEDVVDAHGVSPRYFSLAFPLNAAG
jgi:hypothetical protein